MNGPLETLGFSGIMDQVKWAGPILGKLTTKNMDLQINHNSYSLFEFELSNLNFHSASTMEYGTALLADWT
jgi:hypothetical protein